MPGPVYTISPVHEMHWRLAVETGGGVYRGVQKGDRSIGLKTLVLFDDASAPKNSRSTMALPTNELTADAVRSHIAAKQKEYGEFQTFAEKACTRVLAQFAPTKEAA
jgi:hypothetical protein